MNNNPKHLDLISNRFYDRNSKDWGKYRVDRFDCFKGKSNIEYYICKFKNTGNYISAPLKTILENRVVDIEKQKKETNKKNRTKKKEIKESKKFEKRYVINLGEAPRVLGLDLSSHSTGVSVFINGNLEYYNYIYQPKSIKWDTQRINHMKNEIIKIIKEYKINVVAMEDIIFKSKRALYVLSKLQGVVCDLLYKNNMRYCLITPREWKAEYDINRDSNWKGKNSRLVSKNKTVDCVNSDFKLNLQEEFKDYPKDLPEPAWFDVADAIAIGYIALKNRIKK